MVVQGYKKAVHVVKRSSPMAQVVQQVKAPHFGGNCWVQEPWNIWLLGVAIIAKSYDDL
jgi:hypothetical protein